MRLQLATLRVTNVNLEMEPGCVWLTVMNRSNELRGVRLEADQLKDLLVHGVVEVVA